MIRKGLMATMLMLALVCLVFSPVLSVEDPWDVDTNPHGNGGLGDSGDPADTTDVEVIVLKDRHSSTGDEDGSWFDGALMQTGFGLIWDFYYMFSDLEGNQPTEPPAVK